MDLTSWAKLIVFVKDHPQTGGNLFVQKHLFKTLKILFLANNEAPFVSAMRKKNN